MQLSIILLMLFAIPSMAIASSGELALVGLLILVAFFILIIFIVIAIVKRSIKPIILCIKFLSIWFILGYIISLNSLYDPDHYLRNQLIVFAISLFISIATNK